jgi:glucose/arabinose dehydrogenase
VFKKTLANVLVVMVMACASAGCQDTAHLPGSAGFGPNPTLPAPHAQLIPTVRIAPAKGWSNGATPVAAAGISVHAVAENLEHQR